MAALIRGTPAYEDEQNGLWAQRYFHLAATNTLTALIAIAAVTYMWLKPAPPPDVIALDARGHWVNQVVPFPGTTTPDYLIQVHVTEYVRAVFSVDADYQKEMEMLAEVRDASTPQTGTVIKAFYEVDDPIVLGKKCSQSVEILSMNQIPNVPGGYEAHIRTRRTSNTDYHEVSSQNYWLSLRVKTGPPQRTNVYGIYFDALSLAKEGTNDHG